MLIQVSFLELNIINSKPWNRALAMMLYAKKYLIKNFLVEMSIPTNLLMLSGIHHCNITELERTSIERIIHLIVGYIGLYSNSMISLKEIGRTFLILEVTNAPNGNIGH